MVSSQQPEPIRWSEPEQPLSLGGDAVHLWRIVLDVPRIQLERLWTFLSGDERQRAGKFYFHRDRDKYVAARGSLREILGRYLMIPPGEISFVYGDHGKPAISGDRDAETLEFNLSHSGELALVGVTRGRKIGVDVERIVDRRADEQIARRFFSMHEVRDYLSLPREQRKEAFFRCWTRKESYIKARGEGLSRPLEQFDVSLKPGEQAALLESRIDSTETQQWTLSHVDPADGYVGAVAVYGRISEVRYWEWIA